MFQALIFNLLAACSNLQSSVESKDSENLLSKKILTMKNLDNSMMLGISLLLFFLQSAETAAASPTDDQLRPNKSEEKHFVLVHGACHGAWSWYKVVAMLRSSGHNVTALDLGASGINPLQALEIPHQSDYFRPLMLFMAALPSTQRLILVAHSLGGLAISKAMETFPQKISVAVFVTAIMPGPSLNISTLTAQLFRRQGPLLDSRYSYDKPSYHPDTRLQVYSRVHVSAQPSGGFGIGNHVTETHISVH